jgi:hypothetical protein
MERAEQGTLVTCPTVPSADEDAQALSVPGGGVRTTPIRGPCGVELLEVFSFSSPRRTGKTIRARHRHAAGLASGLGLLPLLRIFRRGTVAIRCATPSKNAERRKGTGSGTGSPERSLPVKVIHGAFAV